MYHILLHDPLQSPQDMGGGGAFGGELWLVVRLIHALLVTIARSLDVRRTIARFRS